MFWSQQNSDQEWTKNSCAGRNLAWKLTKNLCQTTVYNAYRKAIGVQVKFHLDTIVFFSYYTLVIVVEKDLQGTVLQNLHKGPQTHYWEDEPNDIGHPHKAYIFQQRLAHIAAVVNV